MIKKLTLCIVHNHPQVLLGMKKRGFGAGRWNGFGGKVELGEALEDAAKRELLEEAGIKVADIEKVGKIDFKFVGDTFDPHSTGSGQATQGKPVILEVNIFKAGHFEGEPAESEEMKPQWFHVDEIPFDKMWPDDKYWLPLFLEGKKFKGKFVFQGQDKILKYELNEIQEI